jgi:hypothetical protein
MEASPVSLMPEGLTAGMGEGDLRDFFAYLMITSMMTEAII